MALIDDGSDVEPLSKQAKQIMHAVLDAFVNRRDLLVSVNASGIATLFFSGVECGKLKCFVVNDVVSMYSQGMRRPVDKENIIYELVAQRTDDLLREECLNFVINKYVANELKGLGKHLQVRIDSTQDIKSFKSVVSFFHDEKLFVRTKNV
jgi:hypothetical protein